MAYAQQAIVAPAAAAGTCMFKHSIICLIRRKWRWQRSSSSGSISSLMERGAEFNSFDRSRFNLNTSCSNAKPSGKWIDRLCECVCVCVVATPQRCNVAAIIAGGSRYSCIYSCSQNVPRISQSGQARSANRSIDRCRRNRKPIVVDRRVGYSTFDCTSSVCSLGAAFAIHDDNSINCENVLETNSYSQCNHNNKV